MLTGLASGELSVETRAWRGGLRALPLRCSGLRGMRRCLAHRWTDGGDGGGDGWETSPAPTSHTAPPLRPPPSPLFFPRQVVVNLYAQILESHTGPARVKKGLFSLPMRKVDVVGWSSFGVG